MFTVIHGFLGTFRLKLNREGFLKKQKTLVKGKRKKMKRKV